VADGANQTEILREQETVEVDGKSFRDTRFQKCTLIYSGGSVPVFDNCHFEGCTWTPTGPALNTMLFLRSLLEIDPHLIVSISGILGIPMVDEPGA